MRKITLLMLFAFTTITVQAQNKLLSSIREYNNNGTWEKSNGTNYEYDSNNNLITETELEWDPELSIWKNSYKTTYTYNASNKVTQALYSYREFNSQTNQYDNYSYRDIYTYTNGRLTGIESQDFIGSNWENEYKFVITYNSNNLPEIVISYEWAGSQWVNDERTTYTFNGNNKISSSINQEWVGSQWVNSFKSLYTYNANNKMISDRGANWDEFNNIWVEAGANRNDYEWDATGNRISTTTSGNYNSKEEYTYDTSKLLSTFAHPFKDKTGVDYFEEDFPYVNKVLTETSSNGNSRTTYNYSSLITLGTETLEIADKSINVYPNPTQDFLYIKSASNASIDKITVTDLAGKKVLEQNKPTQINVQNLAKGMYVIEVFVGENRETRKFIKE